MEPVNEIAREDLQRLDRDDPLAGFRAAFALPPGVIYLDGNSLGAMPWAAGQLARQVVEKEWAKGLVTSWNEAGWFGLPVRLGGKIAGLIGAEPDEVIVTDSTGIDLYKALAVALQHRPERRVIVMEGSNFPTDNYVVQGLVGQLGDGYEIRFAEAAELGAAIDRDVAAVCLTHVHYKSGRILDMAAITKAAHEYGAMAVWDLCHSAGAMPVDLNACHADFAVGCTYKYLNGGPGSPGFIFVAGRHLDKYQQPLTGWWGHAEPFAFERDYRPAPGIRQLLSGTQPVLSLAVAEAGIDIMCRADMRAVRQKSMHMTDLLIELVENRCVGFGLELASPRDAASRGSQVSFHHESGLPVMQALISRGVIGDYRAPGNMRFGVTPLYLRYTDIWDAVEILWNVLETGVWREPEFSSRGPVT